MWRHGKLDYYTDAYSEETSSWLRWLNCSRHSKEENVDILDCFGKSFYITTKDIYPGQELLIYYGVKYAEKMGIDVPNYHNMGVDIRLLEQQDYCDALWYTSV